MQQVLYFSLSSVLGALSRPPTDIFKIYKYLTLYLRFFFTPSWVLFNFPFRYYTLSLQNSTQPWPLPEHCFFIAPLCSPPYIGGKAPCTTCWDGHAFGLFPFALNYQESKALSYVVYYLDISFHRSVLLALSRMDLVITPPPAQEGD